MSYKNLNKEAREGLSRGDMKNCKINHIKPTKKLFTWIPNNLDFIIYGMMIVLGFVGVVGVYFDWLKL